MQRMQVDMYLPNLHRRQAVMQSWRATHCALEERMVAAEQRHCRCFNKTWPWNAARGEQDAPARLGKPRACACTVEEGRKARASQDQNECVSALIILCVVCRVNLFGLIVCHGMIEKQLLEQIALVIQRIKPDNVPREPYSTDANATSNPALAAPTPISPSSTSPVPTKPQSPAPAPSHSPAPASTPALSKGKQPAVKVGGKVAPASAATATIAPPPTTSKSKKARTPVPPAPLPPLTNRVSAYSPALPSGVLIEAVKAGMNAQEGAGPAIGGGGGGKGKRKVVRVRG